MWIKSQCRPGNYTIVVEASWRSFVDEFTLSSYGVDKVRFNLNQEMCTPLNFYEEILASKANMAPVDGVHHFTMEGEPNISYKFEHCNDGFGYFFFNNKSISTTLTAVIEVLEKKNCQFRNFHLNSSPIVPKFKDMRHPMAVVCPKKTAVIPYRILDDDSTLDFKVIASFKKNSKFLIEQAMKKGKQFSR